ncbi:hypothetical protein VP01_3861g4 [Puccinia sorghi]|uniref:Uncharacterized protein n=1 Tax=Puccinia sorghi TaxID=27349 RepID=A0A0L6UT01_9BASI|nr:hypothetical protein VP01_3861g4 [Puccinia sorghi]
MDTDWCIVCDSRTYPSESEVNGQPQTPHVREMEPGIYTFRSTSSAFCSTSCLLKAYREAEIHNSSGISAQRSNTQHAVPPHHSSHLRPHMTPTMLKAQRPWPHPPFTECHHGLSETKATKRKLITLCRCLETKSAGGN